MTHYAPEQTKAYLRFRHIAILRELHRHDTGIALDSNQIRPHFTMRRYIEAYGTAYSKTCT